VIAVDLSGVADEFVLEVFSNAIGGFLNSARLSEDRAFELALIARRDAALDRALERRIAIKIEFQTPSSDLRRRIWHKHLPPAMPLASGVDFDLLARPNLTGGEIKNAVLNAARIALARDPHGPVTALDFEQAIKMELDGRWNREGLQPIGFGSGSGADRKTPDGNRPIREAAKNGKRKAKTDL
jgi:SpoVK/Ycf46/Vps4 family AAA+-type ATPase